MIWCRRGLEGDDQRRKFGSVLDATPLCDDVVKLNGICANCKINKVTFIHRMQGRLWLHAGISS